MADQFTPESFELGARGFGVEQFGREPGVEFLALVGSELEFFELGMEG